MSGVLALLTLRTRRSSRRAPSQFVSAPVCVGTTLRRYFVARRWVPGRVCRGGGVAVLALLFTFALSLPASAHGGNETEVGYELVQQALGHLAHDTSHAGIALAMEKVDDALATKDQHGVDVAAVKRAQRALEADQADSARTLLQGSIKKALSELPPATGEETGTTVIVPAMPGRDGLAASDWALIAASLLCLVAGALLAYRFRPTDTVGELRRRYEGSR